MLKKLGAAGLLLLVSIDLLAQAWYRIDAPSQVQRANMPASARDYGGFIWMPEGQRSIVGPNVQRIERPFSFSIDGESYDPLHSWPNALDDVWHSASANPEADFRLVQLFGPPRAEDLAALKAAGIRPVRFLSPLSYIVWADRDALVSAAANRSNIIRWAGDFLPSLRVPAQSRSVLTEQASMALVDKESTSKVIGLLELLGAKEMVSTVFTSDLTLLQFTLLGERYFDAAQIPGVFTLQAIAGGAGLRGEMANQSIVGGYDANFIVAPGYQSWLTPTNIDGSGVKVAIIDGGIRTTHLDLAGAIAPCLGTEGSCTSATSNHGSHVTGAVAGRSVSGIRDSGGFLLGQGLAPGAKVIQMRFGVFLANGPGSVGGMQANGMLKLFKDAAVSGAHLANNSWGLASTPQGYDIPTLQADMAVRDANPAQPGQQPILAVWSIMNGNGELLTGSCAPSSLGSPDEAKNTLSVGSTALQTVSGSQIPGIFNLSDNSAHGPACDQRIIPNIVAPGCHTASTSGANDAAFAQACGTSMAAPMVSGVSALFWQWYKNTHGVDPSPALVKAVLSASAENLKGKLNADGQPMPQRPNRFSGWGRLNLSAILKPSAPIWFHDQAHVLASSGETWGTRLEPVDANLPVRLMLAWTDAPGPGTGGTTPAWTNDLDLSAQLNAGSFRGNNFDADSGFSVLGGGADSRNNLEGIFLSPSQHLGAPIDVRVLAAVLGADALNPWQPSSPSQDFAIACLNCRLFSGTYTLSAPNLEIQACRGQTIAPVAVTVISSDGAIQPVTLSARSDLVFESASFTPNPIVPSAQGSSSDLSVAIAAGAPLGPAQLRVTGTAGNSAVSTDLPFDVFAVPSALSLSTPTQAASGVLLTQNFSWTEVPKAQRYRIEFSRSADFGSLTASALLSASEFTLRNLRLNTQYFWRVRAENLCGVGEFSTGSFTTIAEDALFSDGFYE